MRQQLRLVSSALAASLLLAACGARLTPEQQQAALGTVQGNSSNAAHQQTVTDGTGSDAGSGGTTTDVAGAGTGAGTGSGSGGGSSRGGATTRAGTDVQTGGGGGGGGGGGTSKPAASRCTPSGATDVGVTPTSITVANIADMTGPVPGLFQGAQEAALAFAAYWNSTHGGICGRQIKVQPLDSRTDANGYRQQMLTACKSAFAAVGSMSAFDSGGAQVEDQCGIPDISAASTETEHQQAKVAYAAESIQVGVVSSALPGWIAETYPDAVKKAAFLYINAGASAVNAKADIKAYEAYGHGWNFVYEQPVDISTFNYAPYVQKMKQQGVRFVQWIGAYQQAARLAQAMQQQGFKPDMFLLDPTGYNSDYIKVGGAAVDGTFVYTDSAMFSDASSNPEMATYLTWLKRVAGSDAQPSYFGVFAWSAMRLFAETAEKIGPDLTRAKMLAALPHISDWTGNGINAPQHVGAKQSTNCYSFIQLRGGKWTHVHPSQPGFDCRPLTRG